MQASQVSITIACIIYNVNNVYVHTWTYTYTERVTPYLLTEGWLGLSSQGRQKAKHAYKSTLCISYINSELRAFPLGITGLGSAGRPALSETQNLTRHPRTHGTSGLYLTMSPINSRFLSCGDFQNCPQRERPCSHGLCFSSRLRLCCSPGRPEAVHDPSVREPAGTK